MKLTIMLFIIAAGSYLLLEYITASHLQPLGQNLHHDATAAGDPASRRSTGPRCTYRIESDYLGRDWIVHDTSGDKVDYDRCLLYQRQPCLEHDGCRLRKQVQGNLDRQ